MLLENRHIPTSGNFILNSLQFEVPCQWRSYYLTCFPVTESESFEMPESDEKPQGITVGQPHLAKQVLVYLCSVILINGFISTWILHEIIMFSNKVTLEKG